ncbi:ABC transporter ATP-binding protein [Kribbella sp. NBC_00482]|uniref:ABC transporter ATP-binding protein n=1 Tax=Kribbella sp. NBC_00482 TaxID=2975968 RepID=UPI002E1967E8
MTISVRNLTRGFEQKVAVNDVSFDVGENEFLVLVGPSGCGKTTTLRLVAGLEEAERGEIHIGGEEVTAIRPRDRDIAMVFQDYAIFPHLTVYENIAYGLRSRRQGSDVIADRVPHAAEVFRISPLLKRKPRQLSGGERQRVALARALVRDARAYLFDEPLSNLDAQLRHQAREDILALHKRQQKPTIYVTHDQDEAMSMGDRIAVMRDGEIQQIGTGRELYETPVNLFVAFFIGTPSINVFDVRLEPDPTDEETVVAVGEELRIGLPAALAAPYAGRTVKLGVRPEDLQSPRQAKFAVTDDNTVHATVEIIEPTTTGSTAYLTLGSQDVAATFASRLPERYVGQEVPLAVDVSKVRLFDAETERAL